MFISVQFIYILWNRLPSAVTIEVNIIHTEMLWSQENAIPPIGPSLLLMSPSEKKLLNLPDTESKNVSLPTNMSVPPTPFSQGGDNQSIPEHKNREVSS